MKTPLCVLLSASLAVTPVVGEAASSTPRTERADLRRIESPRLAEKRAGAAPATAEIRGPDRAALRRLERQHRELGDRRAGDLQLSNDELTTILLVLLIVIALAILI